MNDYRSRQLRRDRHDARAFVVRAAYRRDPRDRAWPMSAVAALAALAALVTVLGAWAVSLWPGP